MAFPYMIPVYALLVQAGSREITSLPKQYQVPVAEYLAAEVEKNK
ncbi:CD1375 family protein [Viridibacillus arvi]